MPSTSVIWEKSVRKEWCKTIAGKKKCVKLSGAVRILAENGTYALELKIGGATKRFVLGAGCVEASEGIFKLKVCVTSIEMQNGRLKSFKILVEGCVDTSIGPVHIKECVKLLEENVKVSKSSSPHRVR